jgi:hypothetical protein
MMSTLVSRKSILGIDRTVLPASKSVVRASGAVAAFAALLVCNPLAFGIVITVANPGFENVTGVSPTNTASFDTENAHNLHAGGAGSYNGWSESQPNFSAPGTNISSLGLINVGSGDFPFETFSGDTTTGNGNGDEDENPDVTFPKIAVYSEADGRVSQTTGYAISGLETSFTMTVNVGKSEDGGYRGYNFSIYRDNAGVKTILGTLSSSVNGGDPTDGNWVNKSLTISGNFSAFSGQLIGASLYQDNLGGETVWYDDVALSYEAVPEPASFALALMGGIGLLVVRRRRAA